MSSCPCCVQQNTPNAFFYIYLCIVILTWNGCLRELNAAIPETDLVIVITEQTLNNIVIASLLTLFITLFVICYLRYYFVTKRIIILSNMTYLISNMTISMLVCIL